jgi:hypothetical protein
MSSNENAVSLNKFYTNKEAVKICYDALKKYLKINKKDLIIEPSAGAGSFINIIKRLSNNYIFYDIKPEHIDVTKANFLNLYNNFTDSNNPGCNCHIIGNPPFGSKSSMAIKFIKHSANVLKAKSISFILPISFKKSSFKKSFPLNYHLIYDVRLPLNSFTYFGKNKEIKTIFQIWERKNHKRRKPHKLLPAEWYFFSKKENSDISIRRVGSNAGFAKITTEEDNINTHWFIKINKYNEYNEYNELLNKLNKIKYNKTNNIAAISISKQDIIIKYNKILL